MPQTSRYNDEEIEIMLAELAAVLEKHQAPTDLSLMVLGNMITHLLNTRVSSAQRVTLARSFAEALQASVKDEKAH